jgi:hypothetical protein
MMTNGKSKNQFIILWGCGCDMFEKLEAAVDIVQPA